MAERRMAWYRIALYAAVAALCVLVVLLARENRQLEDRLQTVSREQSAEGNIQVGDYLSEFAVTELDGSFTSLAFDGVDRESIVLLFTTTCSACQQNVDPWLELHERVRGRYRFAAIGIDDPELVRTFAEAHALPFEVFVPVDRQQFPETHHIVGVPQTLVVGSDGRVKDIRLGVLAKKFLEGFPSGRVLDSAS